MTKKWLIAIVSVLVIGVVLFFIIGQPNIPDADLSKTAPDLNELSVPDQVKLVGVGEGSHGSKEYQELKGEVFKKLVEQGKARTFAIEGDFGGALTVNDYIHGGEGNPEDVATAIGFGIYRTQEIKAIIEWMREYNQTAPEGKDLRFMGFDFQRVDESKKHIFNTLEQGAPELVAKYKPTLDIMNDDNRLDVAKDDLNTIKTAAQNVMADMDAQKDAIVAATDEDTFIYTREAAHSIAQYMDALIVPEAEYNATRDPLMRDKVKWLMDREGDKILYINAHNGHIQKVATSGYEPLGKLLANDLGDKYWTIGVDALKTGFNSQTDTGYEQLSVSYESAFTKQIKGKDQNRYYVEFAKVADDPQWKEIISNNQVMTAVNVSLVGWQTHLPPFYAISLVPDEAFDAMVIYKEVVPTTRFE
ncbi:erythromycin esterase family protein [Stomatohabitans albus]|uniref:erythromycin esterase family protein n=1 Tax=Stomatohabitans albus TaxID=3110766 RepID=UPI00300C2D02